MCAVQADIQVRQTAHSELELAVDGAVARCTRLIDATAHSQLARFSSSLCVLSYRSRRSKSRHMRDVHLQQEQQQHAAAEAIERSSSGEGSVVEESELRGEVDRRRKRTRQPPPSTSALSSDSSTAAAVAPQPAAVFVCGVCAHSFTLQFDLQLHLRSVHQLQPATAAPIEEADDDSDQAAASASLNSNPPRKKRPRPTRVLTCPYAGCDRSFHYAHVLANHVRALHTYETPFACDVCQRAFPTLARKVQHQRSHLQLFDTPS